jgi:hypothetical protein
MIGGRRTFRSQVKILGGNGREHTVEQNKLFCGQEAKERVRRGQGPTISLESKPIDLTFPFTNLLKVPLCPVPPWGPLETFNILTGELHLYPVRLRIKEVWRKRKL